jgi:hypothetical protein
MKSFLASLGVVVLLLCGTACQSTNKAPTMRDATITPASLKPGESGVITVKLADKHDIVDSVVAVVKEDPRVKLKLRDDGVAPDVEAGDGVWTLQVDVPFKAPPGSFTLVIGAYRKDGQPIVVREKGSDVPLTSTATVSITYEGAPAADAAAPAAPAPAPAPAAEAPAAPAAPAPAEPAK